MGALAAAEARAAGAADLPARARRTSSRSRRRPSQAPGVLGRRDHGSHPARERRRPRSARPLPRTDRLLVTTDRPAARSEPTREPLAPGRRPPGPRRTRRLRPAVPCSLTAGLGLPAPRPAGRRRRRRPRGRPHVEEGVVTTMLDLREAERLLAERVDGEVRFDAGTRAAYSTDASNFRQLPYGVVVPRTTEAAAEA